MCYVLCSIIITVAIQFLLFYLISFFDLVVYNSSTYLYMIIS